MLFKIVVIFLAVTFCSAKVYQDCGSQAGSFVSLKINDCDVENKNDCTVYKGQTINIEISFTNISSNSVLVHAKLEDLDSPGKNSVLLHDGEGCSGYGLDCPLQATETYTFKASIPTIGIHTSTLHWELNDLAGKGLICLHIAIWTEYEDPEE